MEVCTCAMAWNTYARIENILDSSDLNPIN